MKSLIKTENGSDLSQISPVLSCIRSLNESGFILDDERYKYIKSLSLKQLKDEEVSQKEGFWFAVSLHDGSCLYTSEAITDHLGYVDDMLIGQCFMNFLYHKDHLTFANHLTQGLNVCFTQGKRDDSYLVPNTFFCRIRVYHGLKYGYEVANRKPQYKPFRIILHINDLILDDMCVEKPSATLCVRATATQVLNGYAMPNEIPAMTSFSTRHTATCHFSHIDSSAIPYLGFLPQDMIGYSVFDFYHTDDMLQLKDIYELVIKEHGSAFRSKPYRFKVHNGCYVVLETEWSCFINPWSHKLEFVVGKHKVLNGPSDINIFTPCELLETDTSDEIFKETVTIQNEIKAILSKTLENFEWKKKKRLCSKRKRDLASFVHNCIEDTKKKEKQENGERQDIMEKPENNSDLESIVMGDISPLRETSDSSISTPPAVLQMRYQENIDRFFASQPMTYLENSDELNKNEKPPSVEEDQSNSTCQKNESGSVKELGAAVKEEQSTSPNNYNQNVPVSGCSSSKNMFSFTTGDSGYKSWKKDETNEHGSSQTDPPEQSKTENSSGSKEDSITFSSCLALTEESLHAHNRMNHKQLRQQRATTTHRDTNRIQQNDTGNSKHKKFSRTHNLKPAIATAGETSKTVPTSVLGKQCPVSIQNQKDPENSPACATNSSHTHSHFHSNCPGSLPTPYFIPAIFVGSLPCLTSHPAMNPYWPYKSPNDEASANGSTLNSPCNCYLNAMLPPYPFPMFNPTNCNHAANPSGVTTTSFFSSTTTTVTTAKSKINKIAEIERKSSHTKKEKTFAPIQTDTSTTQPSESNESDMQADVSLSSSSSSSFIKSFSQHSEDKEEDMDLDLKMFYTASCSDKVELSSEIAYRYQMKATHVEEVLKKDNERLMRMQQPALVNQQLHMLQEEIKDENESRNIAEDDFCITEDVMLGLTAEEEMNEVS